MSIVKPVVVAGVLLFSGLANAEVNPELECLAKTIYHSAFGADYDGKRLVGELVLNRVESDIFPDTVC